jgi:hypothetical protein
MHLSPAAIESAIKLLDQPVSELVRGDIGETGQVTRMLGHREESGVPTGNRTDVDAQTPRKSQVAA